LNGVEKHVSSPSDHLQPALTFAERRPEDSSLTEGVLVDELDGLLEAPEATEAAARKATGGLAVRE
jgi:hypothetical protein